MLNSLHFALRTLELETKGLQQLHNQLKNKLAEPFGSAITLLQSTVGRLIVTGIGKSGHIGQKLAATFASTGTPSFFVHPSEASHGDLGMITGNDVILAISWSGETTELANILTYSRRFAVPLISLTSRLDSALGQASDLCLLLPRAKEACPHGLAPTTSTTITLALGDCLAMALLEAKGFSAHDFKQFHPGGSLGAKLRYLSDIMHSGEKMPLVKKHTVMSEALLIMTEKSFGCLGVTDKNDKLVGMITDGDLRRHMGPSLVQSEAQDIMTYSPDTLPYHILASAALEQMNTRQRTQMFIVKEEKPLGIVHIHDLLRIGLG
ncbi:MAG: KpsF/GutQ family sugar-phosphate isomerase [Hyphomicrobiaceae bacterium]|nr:KpsF/GutQ family sugar-phosphate isomerase [Hyphomicrobiaceae bacterium]